MKKRKYIFILMMTAAVAACFFLYFEKHGIVGASGPSGEISAQQAILIDGDTGEVLYEKAADERAYPASITKIMTALITLETLEKYDSPIEQKVRIPKSAAGTEGSSLYLRAGEEISIEDLLYGLMLVSGNDAAEALAEIIGGSRSEFVMMMNNRARELNCRGTSFANPSGLFDEDHYTTARDMATIAREAMKDPTFRKIVASESRRADREGGEYEVFYNKNKTIRQFKGGNGIKIGYTEKSGRTLAASAERKGRTMICVVMGAPDWFNDAYRLMGYGFDSKS